MMTFQYLSDVYSPLFKSRSPRKLSRYATLPRGYKPPIIVKPPKPLRLFHVKGHGIMAYSRRDAIIRLRHNKLI